MQPIFLLLGMDAVPIPDDMKFHIIVVKCERSFRSVTLFNKKDERKNTPDGSFCLAFFMINLHVLVEDDVGGAGYECPRVDLFYITKLDKKSSMCLCAINISKTRN